MVSLLPKLVFWKKKKKDFWDIDERNLTTYGAHFILNHRDLNEWFCRL